MLMKVYHNKFKEVKNVNHHMEEKDLVSWMEEIAIQYNVHVQLLHDE